ncbi:MULTISPECIES: molybdate ABC transporter substrate-binding protein [Megasphaera]|uniref:Molybdate-binding protein ModA n=1 Tax=Megasphaera stantonii TaxID=2144175 RepID=A0A346AYH2_9FIRM|nr:MULTISPECIES: molybdate ABC transporter substrate-binding protein [Megasphaera]AXL20915.1 molybdate ABC transporter substrate-binding protein [Megasphaera stantonii]MBM6732139.1 molybdate ABC transporter substrate-binding protein [Megasphaera stantonii]OUO46554.1 molybdate ABC transporter substrate-binding protein [Megasphaera sp. An286]
MMKWKRALGVALLLAGMAVLAGCGGQNGAEHGKTMLTVFAAASMTETMNEIAKAYQQEHPDVEIVYNFDSSGTLKHQIQNGAACDVFISAAQKQMDQLDASKDERANPERLDFVLPGTRIDLLENKVVLATPEGNPKQIASFDDMAQKLEDGSIRLVMGNSDVPVGQYTQKILAYYGLDEQAIAEQGRITYGSNVKEVTTQVKEGSADCGVIYGTDAYSAGLKPVGEATKDMCGQVVYPAAVLKTSAHQDAAKAFLTYLQGEKAMAVFEDVGFSRAG